ncbi:hypothetical protein FQR65_LT02312 [Abscondita terminalis]|nr:hypothetical protein FQR65_LT02312 [Abscondita terminalis]
MLKERKAQDENILLDPRYDKNRIFSEEQEISWKANSFSNGYEKQFENATTNSSASQEQWFNVENVKVFFENVQVVIDREPHFADEVRIYNLDETSTTTVEKPQNIVASV